MAQVPDDRLDALAEMSKSKKVVPAAVQFVDIGGLVEGASTGEGLGNRFLGEHPRGRRHRVRAAGLRGRRRARRRPTRSTTCAIVELELALADLETVEQPASSKRRKAAKQRQVDPADEVAALEPGPARSSRRARRSTAAALVGRASASCSSPTSCSPTSRCWPWSTSARTSSTTHRREGRARWRPSSAATARSSACACSSRPRRRSSTPDGAGRDARGRSASARARCPGCAQRRLPPARPADVPHHRRQGVPGLDVPGRRQGARVRRRDPHRPRSGASSGPRSSTGTSCSSIGSWTKAKEVGKLRVEGKDYEVVDGDVLEIRFNV